LVCDVVAADGQSGAVIPFTGTLELIGELHIDREPAINFPGLSIDSKIVKWFAVFVGDPRRGESITLVGDLATDTGRTTDGGKNWTYTLRDGVAWEDGSPITSADVKYGLEREFVSGYSEGPTYFQSWIAGTDDFGSVYSGPYAGKTLDAIATREFATTYAGWDFTNVWSAPSAGYYPQLYGVNYVLRVDPANASRTYGDANPAFTYTSYGLHTGDTSAILAGLSLSTTATTTSNVGSYAITAGGSVTSTAGQAYRLIQTPAALTVTPRAITVTADAKSRTYGDANPALTYQVGGSGLVNGDTLSGALATSATTASNVGTYGITQGTLAASSNYTLSSFTGANLTVTPRAITVTADATSRAYGDANPALTYRVGGSGLANGDTLSGALATSATAASDVGVYGITHGSLAASSNYAFTFVGANLTITPVAPQVPTERPGAYARSSVPAPAPQPSGQKFESESIEEPSAAMICKSEPCLKLPHPDNRRIGARARFVDTMTDRNRLPAFIDN